MWGSPWTNIALSAGDNIVLTHPFSSGLWIIQGGVFVDGSYTPTDYAFMCSLVDVESMNNITSCMVGLQNGGNYSTAIRTCSSGVVYASGNWVARLKVYTDRAIAYANCRVCIQGVKIHG